MADSEDLHVVFELPVGEGEAWTVTRNVLGRVTLRDGDTTVATAQWADDKLTEKLIAKGAVTRGQWGQIEGRFRRIAKDAHQRSLVAVGDYMNFLLDPINETPPLPVVSVVRLAPGSWRVRVDREGFLVITALEGERLVVVATATWTPDRITHKQIKNGTVSKTQWTRVDKAIRELKKQRASTPPVAPNAPVATPYVTFMLDLADGDEDRIAPGSLHFAPTSDKPSGAFVWKVACDARGVVRIWSLGMTLVGNATWTGTLTDRKQVTPQLPTAYQWALVERALVLAFERRTQDSTASDAPVPTPAELEPLAPLPEVPSPSHRAFLLDLRNGEIVEGSMRFAPDPTLVPDRVFVWEVTMVGSTVIVQDRDGDRLATGTWEDGLAETAQSGSVPTDDQWAMVRSALNRAVQMPDSSGHTAGKAHVPTTKTPTWWPARKKQRPHLIGVSIIGLMFFTLVVVVAFRLSREPSSTVARTPPATPAPAPAPPAPVAPPPKPLTKEERVAASFDLTSAVAEAGAQPMMLANYRVRWSEVDVASTTTIAQVEKEPAEEVGKRLCVEGELAHITRTDYADRKHYTGALKTVEGDIVEIVISGSAGTLVKRQQARVCGVVIGETNGAATVFGMFDLPENRNPVVEKTE